jgi:hypothetical protein
MIEQHKRIMAIQLIVGIQGSQDTGPGAIYIIYIHIHIHIVIKGTKLIEGYRSPTDDQWYN